MAAARRHEPSEARWTRIASILPGKASDPGRTGDMPERYGKWKTLHKRFTRWAKAGVWDEVFAALIKDRDNQYLMLDSTIVRAHQQAATGKGGPGSGSVAFPR